MTRSSLRSSSSSSISASQSNQATIDAATTTRSKRRSEAQLLQSSLSSHSNPTQTTQEQEAEEMDESWSRSSSSSVRNRYGSRSARKGIDYSSPPSSPSNKIGQDRPIRSTRSKSMLDLKGIDDEESEVGMELDEDDDEEEQSGNLQDEQENEKDQTMNAINSVGEEFDDGASDLSELSSQDGDKDEEMDQVRVEDQDESSVLAPPTVKSRRKPRRSANSQNTDEFLGLGRGWRKGLSLQNGQFNRKSSTPSASPGPSTTANQIESNFQDQEEDQEPLGEEVADESHQHFLESESRPSGKGNGRKRGRPKKGTNPDELESQSGGSRRGLEKLKKKVPEESKEEDVEMEETDPNSNSNSNPNVDNSTAPISTSTSISNNHPKEQVGNESPKSFGSSPLNSPTPSPNESRAQSPSSIQASAPVTIPAEAQEQVQNFNPASDKIGNQQEEEGQIEVEEKEKEPEIYHDLVRTTRSRGSNGSGSGSQISLSVPSKISGKKRGRPSKADIEAREKELEANENGNGNGVGDDDDDPSTSTIDPDSLILSESSTSNSSKRQWNKNKFGTPSEPSLTRSRRSQGGNELTELIDPPTKFRNRKARKLEDNRVEDEDEEKKNEKEKKVADEDEEMEVARDEGALEGGSENQKGSNGSDAEMELVEATASEGSKEISIPATTSNETQAEMINDTILDPAGPQDDQNLNESSQPQSRTTSSTTFHTASQASLSKPSESESQPQSQSSLPSSSPPIHHAPQAPTSNQVGEAGSRFDSEIERVEETPSSSQKSQADDRDSLSLNMEGETHRPIDPDQTISQVDVDVDKSIPDTQVDKILSVPQSKERVSETHEMGESIQEETSPQEGKSSQETGKRTTFARTSSASSSTSISRKRSKKSQDPHSDVTFEIPILEPPAKKSRKKKESISRAETIDKGKGKGKEKEKEIEGDVDDLDDDLPLPSKVTSTSKGKGRENHVLNVKEVKQSFKQKRGGNSLQSILNSSDLVSNSLEVSPLGEAAEAGERTSNQLEEIEEEKQDHQPELSTAVSKERKKKKKNSKLAEESDDDYDEQTFFSSNSNPVSSTHDGQGTVEAFLFNSDRPRRAARPSTFVTTDRYAFIDKFGDEDENEEEEGKKQTLEDDQMDSDTDSNSGSKTSPMKSILKFNPKPSKRPRGFGAPPKFVVDLEDGRKAQVQQVKCEQVTRTHANRHLPVCIACKDRLDGYCSFKGFRCFVLEEGMDPQIGYGRTAAAIFPENVEIKYVSLTPVSADFPCPDPESHFITPLTKKENDEMMKLSARHLSFMMSESIKHASLPKAIHRAQTTDERQGCDLCKTSIFSSYWFCEKCGRDACPDCYEKILDLEESATPKSFAHEFRNCSNKFGNHGKK